MGKKKKQGVCSSKSLHGITQANFRISVKNYAIAKMCKEATTKARLTGLLEFFTGLVQGYDDWYHFMNISDEDFLKFYKELEPDTLKREAQETLNRVLKPGKKKGIVLSTSLGAGEIKAARAIFDKHLGIGGRKP